MIWVFVITYNVLLGFRRYFVPFARKRMLLTPDDITWFKLYPRKLLGRKVHLPPQDAYNAGGMIVAGLMVHVYMAAFFPEEKSAFFSMFNGDVDALYARLHHKKWYEEKLQEERVYEMKVRLEEIEAQEQQTAEAKKTVTA